MAELMNRFGLNQSDVAQISGKPQATISRWLSSRTPSPADAEQLSERLGISPAWLVFGLGQAPWSGSLSPREKLKSAREAAGMTLKDLANATGYSFTVLELVENGTARASEKMVHAICKALPQLEPEDLLSGSDSPRILSETGMVGTYGATPNVVVPKSRRARYVPLLTYAQAGAFDANHADEAYDYEGVLAIDVNDPRAFALRIRGDSMAPRILEGDEVIVCPSWKARINDLVIAKTLEGDVMCKIYTPRGENVVLTSYNPAYPPIELSRQSIEKLFPIAQIVQNLRRE